MDQFPRSSCLYHPGELITNFCTDKSCLMPLCPTCVCSHPAIHPNQRPTLAHINDTLALCLRDIHILMGALEENETQELVSKNILEQNEQWSRTIQRTKCQVLQMVETYFGQLDRSIQMEADKQNRKLGLHLPERIECLLSQISNHTNSLAQMKTDLLNQRCLSTLITFYHESKSNLDKFQLDVQKEVLDNVSYSPSLSVQPEALSKLKFTLHQLLQINFGTQLIKSPRASVGSNPFRQQPCSSASSSRVVIGLPLQSKCLQTVSIRPLHNVMNQPRFSLTSPIPQLSLRQDVPAKFKKTIDRSSLKETRYPRASMGIKLTASKALQDSKSKQFLAGLKTPRDN